MMETIGTQAWANLRPGLIARLTKGVTDLTLDFAAMMLVSDVSLQESYTDESLEALAERIMSICIYLLTFRITIDTARNKEWGEDQEDLALPTSDVQWGMIEQILGMVARVVEASETLCIFDITINLKDSQVFVPRVILSPYTSGSNDLIVDPNMLNWMDGKQVIDHYKKLFRVILGKKPIHHLMIRMIGLFHMLVRALGVIARQTPTRPYDTLEIKLADAYTREPGVSPYREAFGNPILSIVKFSLGTRTCGSLGLSVPPELYGNHNHRTLLLGDPVGRKSTGDF